MTWLLVTGAGLVAETVVIVVLGRRVTARYDAGDTECEAAVGASVVGLLDHDRGAPAEGMDAVGEADE